MQNKPGAEGFEPRLAQCNRSNHRRAKHQHVQPKQKEQKQKAKAANLHDADAVDAMVHEGLDALKQSGLRIDARMGQQSTSPDQRRKSAQFYPQLIRDNEDDALQKDHRQQQKEQASGRIRQPLTCLSLICAQRSTVRTCLGEDAQQPADRRAALALDICMDRIAQSASATAGRAKGSDAGKQ